MLKIQLNRKSINTSSFIYSVQSPLLKSHPYFLAEYILKIYKFWVHLLHDGRGLSQKVKLLEFCRLLSLHREVINSFATCKRYEEILDDGSTIRSRVFHIVFFTCYTRQFFSATCNATMTTEKHCKLHWTCYT